MPVTGVEEVHETDDVSATGDDNTDALLAGVRWSDLDGDGVYEVSFSFGSADSVYGFDPVFGYETGDDYNEPTFGMFSLSDTAKSQFYSIVENLESFTNLDLVEVEESATEAGTVRIVWSEIEDEDAVGWAYLPSNWWGAGDIWLIAENHSESDVDFIHTMIHELGHALGLKHSFEEEGEFPAIDSAYEGVDYTVMSYTVSARFPEATYADLWPQTYMYWDIQALQALYGVDTETTAGADTYLFDQDERYLMTIWDYAGTDTLTVSNGSVGTHIDLVPGSWSNVGTTIEYYDGADFFTDTYSVYIADDTTIENASGAAGDDTIEGNGAGNNLQGNAGNDLITGAGGADVLNGGGGDDVAVGGSGDDQIWAGAGDTGDDLSAGGAGNDEIGGGAGDDLLIGGGADDGATLHKLLSNENASADGNDTLYGGEGNDTLIGGGWDDGAVNDNGVYDDGEAVLTGSGSDVIWAGTGGDLILTASGDDILGGGAGDDTIEAGGGDDILYGGKGDGSDTGLNDVLLAGSGDDIVYGAAGNDSIDGGNGADDLYSGGGSDTVIGGAGDDTLWGGGGDDAFTGGAGRDVFYFASGHGDDTVTDFDVDADVLNLADTTTDFQSAAEVEAAASAQSGGVLIDIGGGDSVFLDGISLSDVSAITFVF